VPDRIGGKPRFEATRVRLEDITKRFGQVVAVEAVNLEIPAGTLLTLLGPSGCGKTTTLRMIAGLEHPTGGRVLIGDEDVTPLPAANRSVTMVFQAYALFPHLSVFENVAYGLRVQRRPIDEIRRRVGDVLDLVGLPGLGERSPGQLSGGQQQRVALARALVMEPRVLLFDEPLSNLDAKLRKRVRADIRQLQQDLGITSVYVTHDQSEALAISDIVVVMNQGRIEQIGSPTDLYRRPASRFVADFIGEANLLPATVQDGAVVLGGYRFAYTQPGIGPGPATLMVRPEAIQVGTAGEGLAGRIRSAFFMGTYVDYIIDTEVGEIGVADALSVDAMFAVGHAVRLVFSPSGLYLLPPS
jgi:iron(III) transport system ATP-binding protein